MGMSPLRRIAFAIFAAPPLVGIACNTVEVVDTIVIRPDASEGGDSGMTSPESGGESQTDGASNPDVDASAPPCDLTKDFQAPVPVTAANSEDDESGAWESADGRTLFFSRVYWNGTAQTDGRTARVDRTTIDAPFGPVSTVENGYFDGENSYDLYLRFTSDGLLAFWQRSPLGKFSYDIMFSSRARPTTGWSTPTSVIGVNTSASEGAPLFDEVSNTLYFHKLTGSKYSLYAASYADGGVTGATQLPISPGDVSDLYPILSPDGLTLYFASDRGDPGNVHVWSATRSSRSVPFSNPTKVPNVNSDKTDSPSGISRDGCRLYLDSTRTGSSRQDIWVATRPGH